MVQQFAIDNKDSFNELINMLEDGCTLGNNFLWDKNKPVCKLEFQDDYKKQLEIDDIINGINKEKNIVNISVKNDLAYIYKETKDGVTVTKEPFRQWVLSRKSGQPLSGNQPYKFYKEYTEQEFDQVRSLVWKSKAFTIYNKAENFMVGKGYTYFKGMNKSDVSLLSFDIETEGLNSSVDKLLLITNTYRKGDNLVSRVFRLDHYMDEGEMIQAWIAWVNQHDPSILLGHNIVMFDLPFINTRANINGVKLTIGRDNEELYFDKKPRELRVDGSQSYTYCRPMCFGREVVDTFFLVIKYDIGKKYTSYKLKSIVAQEGMEASDRVMVDASKMRELWEIDRERVIKYAEEDSKDPIKLYDLMISTFFYLCPVVPKTFQMIIESATGSQINAVMLRSYLQKKMSVAEPSELPELKGAISFAVPGIYRNVLKIDFGALYPSIIRQYKLYDKQKDPEEHFIKIVDYFYDNRQKYKKLYKETNDKYYDDMQAVAKVIANSCYGFLSANGLNYNSPENAAFITAKARELLTFSIKWATNKDIDYWLNLFQEKTK